MASSLGAWYRKRRHALLPIAVAAMTIAAAVKYVMAFRQLTLAPVTIDGAIDLSYRYDEVTRWFAGRPVYTELLSAVYPPQAYAVLWPFLGWNTFVVARWIWAAVSLSSIVWMGVLVSRESGTGDRDDRAFVVAMCLSMNGLGVAVGLGQFIVVVLPALTAGLLLLRRARRTWAIDIAIAILFQIALIKPSLAVPFAWVAMLAARRIRPLVLIVAGYLLLTQVAMHFQAASAFTLVAQWVQEVQLTAADGYGNLKSVLAPLGLASWTMPAALVLLAALGVWTYLRRRSDFWVLVGVAALVTRFWTYHRVYDDAVTMLAMLALFRVAKRGGATGGGGVTAGVLLAVATVTMLAPSRLEFAVHPFDWLFIGAHVGVWLAMLFVLVRAARMPDADTPHLDTLIA